jgi:hypothetical protein
VQNTAIDDPIAALRSILSKKKSLDEKIDEQLGRLLFLYYRYLERFHRPPIDFDDMIDGIIYISLINGDPNG